MSLIERALQDRENGQLWKARQRLEGSLPSRLADQAVLELLGQICWEMKDQPAAGRAWYLTQLDSSEANEARAAYESRHGHSAVEIVRNMAIKAPLNAYPEVVAERLAPLISKAKEDGFRWVEATANKKSGLTYKAPPGRWDTIFGLIGGFIVLVAFFVVLSGLGFLSLFAIVRLFSFLAPNAESGFNNSDTFYIELTRPQLAGSLASLLLFSGLITLVIWRYRRRSR